MPPPPPPKSEIPADGAPPVATESGLRYSVLAEGKGTVHPRKGDLVRVHYTGWLEDGTEFDSSRGKPAPARFAVGMLIEGWNEALTLMTEGARWKLYIPAALGYGEAGAPPRIPPGADLIFDVELVEVRPVPVFRAPDPEAQTRLESGVALEILEPGTGEPLPEGGAFELEYAFWTEDGELLESSVSSGRTIAGRAEDMALPFLREVPFRMAEGAACLVEVPYEQGFGERGGARLPAGSKTIWLLRMVRTGTPSDPPAFVLPADGELEDVGNGLRMKVLAEGEGESPAMGEEVVVHYAGWLEDGSVFDSSWSRGLPATFRLGQVIGGWNQGLQRMRPGGEAILVIPPELGYGQRGAGERIPPGATLVFRVRLLEVKK